MPRGKDVAQGQQTIHSAFADPRAAPSERRGVNTIPIDFDDDNLYAPGELSLAR
ncbi:MAG: hypothetical protein ABIW82_02670 [Dokdonella sp.]